MAKPDASTDAAPDGDQDRQLTLHANCIVLGGRGLLIQGPSGSGKSALSLDLMALGADLVADDRTVLRRAGSAVIASCPDVLSGMIEARGIGLLAARYAGPAAVEAVLNLGQTEDQRLPPRRVTRLLGVELPLLLGHHIAGTRVFAAGLVQYLRRGRVA